MIDEKRILLKDLKTLKACKDGYDWFARNGLDGLPIANLRKIKGDFCGYIAWLRRAYMHTTYDAEGNPTAWNTPDRDKVHCTYDDRGNKLTQRSEGLSAEWTYDEQDNVLTVTFGNGTHAVYTYDDRGNQLTYATGSGYSTTSTYDDRNNRISRIDGSGYKSTYTYDNHGNELTYTTPDRHIVSTYDDRGNLLTRGSCQDSMDTYTYDDAGNTTTATRAQGEDAVYRYESDGAAFKQYRNGECILEIPLL